jgi:hypothetical protein
VPRRPCCKPFIALAILPQAQDRPKQYQRGRIFRTEREREREREREKEMAGDSKRSQAQMAMKRLMTEVRFPTFAPSIWFGDYLGTRTHAGIWVRVRLDTFLVVFLVGSSTSNWRLRWRRIDRLGGNRCTSQASYLHPNPRTIKTNRPSE